VPPGKLAVGVPARIREPRIKADPAAEPTTASEADPSTDLPPERGG
jgi:hypothetical protein